MSTVFFKITSQQDKEVKTFMKEEGYTNKAEFFRFLLKYFKYSKSPNQVRFEKSADELADVLRKLGKSGKLNKTAHEQLADL